MTHPLQRRWLVEELVRRRLPEEGRRYAAAQRRGRIDANPHQVDAVVFALRRIPEGGCILADEVGLGKTIEAGLVMSQLLAEGMRRILLVVPKALLGQWKAELFDLFGLDAREVRADPESLVGDGVFLVHRELAGGEKGAPLLWASDPFELVVIDEAHELFASIHKRYGKDGVYDATSKHAQTAHRVRELIARHRAAVLLLTATPIQNSLLELWGLVQYVEPTGALLGRLATFREIFCEEGDRAIARAEADELRRRLRVVLHRTLRRQADAFLAVPFVKRAARVLTYAMSAEERALYEDLCAWLLSPDRIAMSGGRLLVIGFLRRMASSLPALAASFRRVGSRVRELLGDASPTEVDDTVAERLVEELASDFEDDEPLPVQPPSEAPARTGGARERLLRELASLESFAARAESLRVDAKARCFIEAVKQVRARGATGEGSGKLVVFTESLTTQAFLEALLVDAGIGRAEITLFRGSNDGARAQEALSAWTAEVGEKIAPSQRPSREVAMRLALVHEFRTKSSVFISTEAGAKGLNLQFCETLVNYDLPWNPQRIEQRIGRVHRYGQKRDVTILSFLAQDNEAERLLFDILSQKLELFGTVLDASDAVLHEPRPGAPASLLSAVGFDLQVELARIYDVSRSMAEVAERIRGLQHTFDGRREAFDDEQSRVAELIETRLDEAVQQVFRGYQDHLGEAMAELDHALDGVLGAYLTAAGIPHQRALREGVLRYEVAPAPALPPKLRDGLVVRIGRARSMTDGEVLHVGHPLVDAAVEEARSACAGLGALSLRGEPGAWPEALRGREGRRGRYALVRIAHRGLEPMDQLVHFVLCEGDVAPLADEALAAFLTLTPLDREAWATPSASSVEDFEASLSEAIADAQSLIADAEELRFERMLGQLEHYLADQAMLLRRRQAQVARELEKLSRRHQSEVTYATRAKQGEDLARLQAEDARLQERLAALARGEDDDYRAWVARLHERRYTRPQVERLVEVDFELAADASAGTGETRGPAC